MGNVKSHEDLQVWQMAIDFVTDLYKVTNDFSWRTIEGNSRKTRIKNNKDQRIKKKKE